MRYQPLKTMFTLFLKYLMIDAHRGMGVHHEMWILQVQERSERDARVIHLLCMLSFNDGLYSVVGGMWRQIEKFSLYVSDLWKKTTKLTNKCFALSLTFYDMPKI